MSFIRLAIGVCSLLVLSFMAFYFTTMSDLLTLGANISQRFYDIATSPSPPPLETNNSNVRSTESKNAPAAKPGNVTKQETTLEQLAVTRVLLVTYYRGGSSFLGQMFAQNSEAFYWFEPLDSAKLTMSGNALRKEKGIHVVETDFQLLPNGSLGYLPRQLLRPRTEVLMKTLTCDATSLSKETLSGKFFHNGQGMPRFRPYLQCLGRNIRNKYEICTQVLKKTCLNSTIVAAKVIRYPMYDVPYLMGIIPDLKVIHYVRDPRGIITSRAHIHGWPGAKLADVARYLCTKIEKNLNVFKLMQQRHPEQFLLVKYEDLALKTDETVQRIYEFVGQNIPEKLYKWIEGNTKAKRIDWTYGTRRNSKETAYKWRKSLRTKDYKIITSQCNAVLKALSYQF